MNDWIIYSVATVILLSIVAYYFVNVFSVVYFVKSLI